MDRKTAAKVRKLAETAAALRSGTDICFSITRLTSLKSLCQDRPAAERFVFYLAEPMLEQMAQQSPYSQVSAAEWASYQDLAAQAVAGMRAYLDAPTPEQQATLRRLLVQVQGAQSEYDRPLGRGPFRVIHSQQLLLIEQALHTICARSPKEAGHWAYQTARSYAERYDPRHGAGLIPESAPLLEDIVRFWAGYQQPET